MWAIIGTDVSGGPRLTQERGAGGDGEEVGTEGVDLGEQVGLRRGGDPHDRDHRADPDRDPQGGQRGAQAAGAQAQQRRAEHLRGGGGNAARGGARGGGRS